jgi:uncharacterized protein (DUF1778 family)
LAEERSKFVSNLRFAPDELGLVREAAIRTGMSRASFVRTAALTFAERVLDGRETLNPARFTEG